MDHLSQDIFFAFRQARKNLGFTLVIVVTLALGIGANTAMFSVMSAVLLRYLPVRDPERLVFLHYSQQPEGTSQTGYDDTSLPEPVFEALRHANEVFSDVVAFAPLSARPLPVRFGDQPEEARGDMVSGNFFSGLGVNAVRGRTFTPADEKSHSLTAVLGYGYWSRRFARDASVLGQTLYVKGVPFTIVGVASPSFAGVERDKATDFWIPLTDRADLKPWNHPAADNRASLYGSPHWFFLMMIARLAPGITEAQALARIQPVYQHAAYDGLKLPPAGTKSSEMYFTRARGIEGVRDAYKTPLTLLMYMVALVLAIACANVSMLLVAHNALRQREFSVRQALGGSRWRLFTQLLGESVLLVAAGAALGYAFALFATGALARWSELDVSLAPDATVLLFTTGVSLAVAVVFAIVPLRGAMRVPVVLALRSSMTTTPDHGRMRIGQVVAAVQVALCVVLLVGAALLVRTMRNLNTAALGMRVSGLVVFGVSPASTIRTDADAIGFYQALLARLGRIPGVEAGTVLANRLGSGWSNNTHVTVDGTNPLGRGNAGVRWNAVGPNYLHVLGIPLLVGRDIDERDTPAAPRVALVNQTFAERYLRGTTPLGHEIQLHGEDGSFTVVGVLPDQKFTAVREAPRPMAFVPYTQVAGIASMTVELRTNADPASVLSQAREMLREMSPDLTPLQPMTQQEQFEQSYSDERLFARLAVFFGVLAIVLVATGLFGTLGYRVNRRIGEIGLRMALGAQRRQMLWMVVRESLAIAAAGAAAGVPLAIGAAQLLRSNLFNLSPADPASFALALAGVAMVTMVAAAIPARRASAVDPITAIRSE